jgi:hypothetical protein
MHGAGFEMVARKDKIRAKAARFLLAVSIGKAQHIGRMNCHDERATGFERKDPPAQVGELRLLPRQGGECRCAQSHNELRLSEVDLLAQPPAAPLDFACVRRPVQTTLAARLVFEMFDRIGDVGCGSVDSFGES